MLRPLSPFSSLTYASSVSLICPGTGLSRYCLTLWRAFMTDIISFMPFPPSFALKCADILLHRGDLHGRQPSALKVALRSFFQIERLFAVAHTFHAAEDEAAPEGDEGRRAVREGGAALGVCVLDADAQSATVRVFLRGEGGGGASQGGEAQGGGGTAAQPSAPIADVALRSVTGNGSWSGGDGNSNVAADLTGIRDALNAVLAVLRSHGLVEGA